MKQAQECEVLGAVDGECESQSLEELSYVRDSEEQCNIPSPSTPWVGVRKQVHLQKAE